MKTKNAAKPKNASDESKGRTFGAFLTGRDQKRELFIFGTLYLLIFVAYSITFPHLFVYSDSGMYLYSGITGMWDIYRPMGYSWFISFAGMFGRTEFALFLCQYLLSAVATLSFLFTLKFLFPPLNRFSFYILSALMILSPSIMYANNMLMSDSLFCSLTVLWLTTALWLMHRPSYAVTVLHVALLALAIMTRYIGLFYAIFSLIIALLYFRRSRWHGAVLILLVLLSFQWTRSYTKKQMFETVGVETFSGFAGWQLLNNAVVILTHIDLRPTQLPNQTARQLYADLRYFNDSLYTTEMALSTTLMWNNKLPLKMILQKNLYFSKRQYGEEWVRTGIEYGDFASFLIKKYPGLYIRHFIIPSLIRFFKHHEFIEERVPLVPNKEMKEYFGMDFDQYLYQSAIFQKLNPVRKYTNLLPWIAFVVLGLWASVSSKTLWKHPQTFWPALIIIAFVLAYFGASGVASGNTTWRYSITVYPPLLASLYILYTLLRNWKPQTMNHEP